MGSSLALRLLEFGARRHLVRAGRALETRGLVTGSVGNISVRREDHLLITASRVPYLDMVTRDVVAVDVDSGRWADRRSPSRELPLHLALYRARPEIRAIVHTHSPYATAWSFTGRYLTDAYPGQAPACPRTEELSYYGLDDIPTTGAVEPAGSWQLADAVVCAMPEGGAVLLREHGVVVGAPTLSDALSRAAAVEHQALVAWLVRGVGHDPDRGPAPSLYLVHGRGRGRRVVDTNR